ncbi:hypothetical protein E2C01_037175 [Portunus trituberculatus]|uniref:Uncharacterized protein n=1 Tax=Portunus trituberculatus TaxID=210409 RepID=A0A5B7FDY4_PORTR|nr:hypothetical protein [Portunus trituberculatus]
MEGVRVMVMVEDKGGAFPIARVVERLTIQEGRKEEASEEAPLQHTATHTQEVTATWYWPASHSTHEEHPRRFTQRRAPLSTGSRTRWRPRPRRHHRPPPPTCHLPAASTTRDQPHHRRSLLALLHRNIISTSHIIQCGVMNVHVTTAS